MTKQSRRVRNMLMRTFLSAMITSFSIFVLIVVVFAFSLEDEIFELQVRDAVERFVAENPAPQESQGTLTSLDMDYYVDTDTMPLWLQAEIDPSFRDRPFEVFGEENGHFHAYVHTLEDGRSLYILFNARRFIRSTPQIKGFLLVISSLAGLMLLASFFFLARMSRRVSGPLEHMVGVLADGESVKGRLDVPAKAPKELHALAHAIEERDARIQLLIERERQFNRDASHELRTPLAVAFGAAEVLNEKEGGSRALTRLMSAIKDMQQLTEGILWLGREPGKMQQCDISAVCTESVRAYRHLVGDRELTVHVDGLSGTQMPVPEPVAHVMIGNILRNAIAYTERGDVTVIVGEHNVSIRDTGAGFGEVDISREGFGVGLTLVKRLCDHFAVHFDLAARPEGGSIATLSW